MPIACFDVVRFQHGVTVCQRSITPFQLNTENMSSFLYERIATTKATQEREREREKERERERERANVWGCAAQGFESSGLGLEFRVTFLKL